MKRCLLFFFAALILCDFARAQHVTLSKEVLADKIKGGWAAQTIGVTYGGPTEFRFNGTFIQDYVPIHWYDGYLKDTYERSPGLYDDIYMDLTFVDVLEKEGLDAPAEAFARSFAHAEYWLWHANQMARYNILNGIMPPASGHWLNNPDADDIDFQIEADFAGLMAPGMPQAAAEVCDRVGHIMNSGDGYYGGVYVATMYALAFVHDDVQTIVREALKAIPEQSQFHQTIRDVIQWHEQYPDDWKRTWFEIQRKWSSDVGCPDGVFTPFNIDAKINAAYVVLGLLYGEGDFGKTLAISTRAGQDSDCNPATAGGVLGTVLGYDRIPAYWKQGLAEVEPIDFRYTTISLNDVYGLSLKHALEMIERNGGKVTEEEVTIAVQEISPVPFEENFTGHFPVERRHLGERLRDSFSFEFEGVGFAINGGTEKTGETDKTLEVEVLVDGESVGITRLPTEFTTRKFTPFWRYQLPRGPHTIELRVQNPDAGAFVRLGDLIVYDDQPRAHIP